MITFKEYRSNAEDLNEGWVRKGLGLAYSRASKTHGDKATQDFTSMKRRLTPSLPKDADYPERIDRIEKSLVDLSDGMINLRKQIGSLVAMVNIAILLNERTDTELKKLTKR